MFDFPQSRRHVVLTVSKFFLFELIPCFWPPSPSIRTRFSNLESDLPQRPRNRLQRSTHCVLSHSDLAVLRQRV